MRDFLIGFLVGLAILSAILLLIDMTGCAHYSVIDLLVKSKP